MNKNGARSGPIRGLSMVGISLGPVTGRLRAEVQAGVPPAVDIGLFKPDRY